jgi:hypothetical protein
MKLFARALIILAIMIAGAWLGRQPSLSSDTFGLTVYVIYLLIGIFLGSTANPRFTKPKNKWVYALPVLIFVVIGALHTLSPLLHAAAWPLGIGTYLLDFSALSWTVVGFFLSLAFR